MRRGGEGVDGCVSGWEFVEKVGRTKVCGEGGRGGAVGRKEGEEC